MEDQLCISFSDRVEIGESTDGKINISSSYNSITLKKVTPGLKEILESLSTGHHREEDLSTLALENDGVDGMYKLTFYLGKLKERGLISYTQISQDKPLVTIHPLSRCFRLRKDAVDKSTKYILSRFSLLRRKENDIILECPKGHAQLTFRSPVATGILLLLKNGLSCMDIAGISNDLTEEETSLFFKFLLSAEAVTSVDNKGKTEEDGNSALALWEFHDLFYHSRSRLGRHANPWGKTYRLQEEIKPLPQIKPLMSEDIIDLYKPDIEGLKKNDASFTKVLETRESLRNHADAPMSCQQLGEFLYRCARVKEKYDDELGGVTKRPYPGGGALHALEVYPVIDRCEGIPAGLYHYDPMGHRLCKLSERTPYVDAILDIGWHMIREESRLQVEFVITARFQRIQWKYEAIAYSVILKDLGGLYQTMYLVGTAMGLSSCALGGGNADLFAEAAGLDYYSETSVGAFALGTPSDKKPKSQKSEKS